MKYQSRKQLTVQSTTQVSSTNVVRHLTLISDKSKSKFKYIDDFLVPLSNVAIKYLMDKVQHRMGSHFIILDTSTLYQSTGVYLKIKQKLYQYTKDSIGANTVLNESDADKLLCKSIEDVYNDQYRDLYYV